MWWICINIWWRYTAIKLLISVGDILWWLKKENQSTTQNAIYNGFPNNISGINVSIQVVGKFRTRLIEFISFKPKLLIRFIMNKSC